MLDKKELEYYKDQYANFNHDKFMTGRPVGRVSTHINELVDSHLEALEEIRRWEKILLKSVKRWGEERKILLDEIKSLQEVVDYYF